jgi:periplasmic protein TonB
MKKIINLSSLITTTSLLLLMSCNSNDSYTEPATTTETAIPDSSQNLVTDSGHIVNIDSINKTSMTKTDAPVKARKGKVSSIMMTNSGKNSSMNKDKEGYYSSVEVLPMFPGGQNALNDFVSNNIEYPENANENGIEGMVTVNFAVDEAGKVSNPRITGKPLGYGLEEEVLKAVNKMPTWTPGVIKGKNVKTYYTLPVNFKLEN